MLTWGLIPAEVLPWDGQGLSLAWDQVSGLDAGGGCGTAGGSVLAHG